MNLIPPIRQLLVHCLSSACQYETTHLVWTKNSHLCHPILGIATPRRVDASCVFCIATRDKTETDIAALSLMLLSIPRSFRQALHESTNTEYRRKVLLPYGL